jgi:hypothetical protein
MNKNVMWCCLQAAKVETVLKVYASEFYRRFMSIYPELSSRILAQNLFYRK